MPAHPAEHGDNTSGFFLLLFPRLRLRQFGFGYGDQLRQPLGIVNLAIDQETVLCARVRWCLDDITNEVPAGFRRLDEQLVVADQRNHFVVRIQRVPTKHRAEAHVARHVNLIDDVLNEFLVTCHNSALRRLANAAFENDTLPRL